MNRSFKVIVIGLGALGSASLYQLSKTNKKILGIDQFNPPHTKGSSHGGSRIIRQAIGEGEEYVPLVLRSYDIWLEIEKLTGQNLFEKCGCLILGKPNSLFLKETVSSALKYSIPHKILKTEEVRKKFPQFKIN